jgi:hypothetical protein
MPAEPTPFAGHSYTAVPRSDGRAPRGLLAPKLQARLERLLAETMGPALRGAGLEPGPVDAVRGDLAAFFRHYADRPVQDARGGGSGLNDSLWLYLVARAVGPERIVESGTFRGQGAWVLHQACPAAPIDAFDVDTGRVAWTHPNYRVHQREWTDLVRADPANAQALAVFDDHISHARRVVEAHARGFRWILLDDNLAAHQVHATGGPPLPTLAMVMDEGLEDGEEIAWTRNGKDYRWTFDAAAAADARTRIASHHQLPELARITAHPPGSGLTLVRLRTPAAG